MLFFVREGNPELFRYTWDAVREPHEIIVLPSIHRKWLLKLCHLLWKLCIFPKVKLYDDSIYEKLNMVSDSDCVVFYSNPRSVCSLVPFLPKGRSRVWFWDSIAKMYDWQTMIDCLQKLKVPLATFDPQDAQTYDMSFYPSFYGMELFKKERESGSALPENPVLYFCGLVDKSKNRRIILAEIEKRIQRIGGDWRLNTVCGVAYSENIRNVRECSCLVEINQTGQVGLTLRALESICFGKKLITNNPSIKQYDFYDPNNIFVWGSDDDNAFEAFLSNEYHPIPEFVISKYDVNQRMNELVSLEN